MRHRYKPTDRYPATFDTRSRFINTKRKRFFKETNRRQSEAYNKNTDKKKVKSEETPRDKRKNESERERGSKQKVY